MKRVASIVVAACALGIVALAGAAGCGKKGGGRDDSAPGTRADARARMYHCPMHPQVVSDRPGDCPICFMKLVPIEEPESETQDRGGKDGAAAPGERSVLFYRNPMDPRVTSPVPMKDAMGMDYVPVYADHGASGTASPAGYAPVTIDAAKQQLIGLKLDAVARGPFETTIRTVGRVALDETRVHHVHTRYEGYVEQVFADFTGKVVRKGEPLLSIYSPDLLATQEEYLLALAAARRAPAADRPDSVSRPDDLVASARRRLELWEVSSDDIDALERSGKPSLALKLYAPITGVVTARTAYHGMKVTPEDVLFDLADLSRVWVLADVYEYELPRVSVGQRATTTLAYWPGRRWTGRVAYVFPTVDAMTRTAKVRIDLDNSDGDLKPGMFADVVVEGEPKSALTVPDDAVLDSGLRKIVFVSVGEGRLEPREVVTGDHAQGRYEVLSGLAEGDSVAIGANFLLDSESRLRAAIAAATRDAGRDD